MRLPYCVARPKDRIVTEAPFRPEVRRSRSTKAEWTGRRRGPRLQALVPLRSLRCALGELPANASRRASVDDHRCRRRSLGLESDHDALLASASELQAG
jgi:hypothetical protein